MEIASLEEITGMTVPHKDHTDEANTLAKKARGNGSPGNTNGRGNGGLKLE